MHYLLNSDHSRTTLTVFVNDELQLVEDTHDDFEAILEAVQNDDGDAVLRLINKEKAVSSLFEKVSDRVSVSNGLVYFDGKAVENVLTDHVLKSIREGSTDHLPFVRFWEKLEENPSEHSKTNLLDWLMADSFSITDDGDIIGYKGVTQSLLSKNSGHGVVNGVPVNGQLDNTPGNFVEVARSYVEHDPRVGCSTGLHVGTWSYASGFSSIVIEVHVNPRDVVSVPTDCSAQKMRVCAYTSVRLLDEGYSLAVLGVVSPPVDEDEDEDEDEDDYLSFNYEGQYDPDCDPEYDDDDDDDDETYDGYNGRGNHRR